MTFGKSVFWACLTFQIFALAIPIGIAHGGQWVKSIDFGANLSGHSATLLNNGNVLIVGGSEYGTGPSLLVHYRTKVLMYAPMTNSWGAATSLPVTRSLHSATLLPNGKVLVVGGVTFNSGSSSLDDLRSSLIYDPDTNTWSSVASMGTARHGHTAILLSSGKVLVFGGSNGNFPLISAEVYDPYTNAWTTVATMIRARSGYTASLLTSGKVLVAGGSGSSAELYDSVKDTWTAVASMICSRAGHTASLLPNGKVLVTGGTDGTSYLTSAEIYDPGNDTWTASSSMTEPRAGNTATVLSSGKVLLAGGAPFSTSCELYSVGTDYPTATVSMSVGRSGGQTATLLDKDKVLIVGGPSGEIYDPTLGTPAAVTVTGITKKSFILSWDTVPDSVGYYIDVATDSGFSNIIANLHGKVVGQTTSYLITGLLPDSGYYCRVRAYSTDGPGGNSTTLKVKTLFPTLIQLPKTGQACVDCTGSGLDGDARAGVAWPEPRFIDNGDQTITDRLTGNIWAKDTNSMKIINSNFDNFGTIGDGFVAWQMALDYIAKLNFDKYLGFNDWQLPNINDLISVQNYGIDNTATWLTSLGFLNVTANSGFWSSTTGKTTNTAFYLPMYNPNWIGLGTDVIGKSASECVWPVRKHRNNDYTMTLASTGQIKCYDANGTMIDCQGTGQDGEYQKGGAWPTSRFVNDNTGLITDLLLGLNWTSNSNLIATKDSTFDVDYRLGNSREKPRDGQVKFSSALAYIKKLNVEKYLGYDDWRLPNVNELFTMRNGVGIPDYYWSSTTNNGSWGAWLVDLGTGRNYNMNVDNNFYIWPVRGGYYETLVNGSCGKSNNGAFTTAPLTDLCASGTQTNFTGSGPWYWSCNSDNGGMDTVCSAKVATQTLTVSFSGTGGGNVYASPVGATWSSDLSSDSVDLPQGTTVTLSALPYSNSTFDGWPGVCNKDGGNCVMTMDAPKSINATFNAAPKVRGAVKQFDTLQAAYNDPTTDNGSIIKLIEGALTGSFTAGRNIGVILEGGYDASYSAIGVTTIIQPPVLIRSGIVRIQGLISIK